MKKQFFFLLSLMMLVSLTAVGKTQDASTFNEPTWLAEQPDGHVTSDEQSADEAHDDGTEEHAHGDSAHEGHDDAGHHATMPAGWSVIPFVALLLMIATGPLFFEHFWHKNYPIIAVTLGAILIGYYAFALSDSDTVIHTMAEYIQFIALLAGLFMASGGILIKVDKKGKPLTNVILLLIGAVLANVMGTTGASMLLIRPFIRLNKERIKAYHIIFFIFMVSNVGGALTPIGDPPLFLGFLKGVPFEWTLTHDVVPWIFAIIILAILFFVIDSRNKEADESTATYSGKLSIKGTKNFLWLAVVIGAVFLDPNVIDGFPHIGVTLHGHYTKISFIRESIMLSVAFLSYYFADQEALKGNEFEFEPIREVAFIFVGIFFTMMPALQLVGDYAKNEGKQYINQHSLYWGTGALSGVLDNAPTYVNFLTAAISADGGNINQKEHVLAYSGREEHVEKFKEEVNEDFDSDQAIIRLIAISIASVFFGAMTYIGNAPNFMVKSIAEQVGIKMPSFFGYVVRFSLPILLPILILVWLVFFQFGVLEMLY